MKTRLKLSTILLALATAGCLNEVNACGNVLKTGPTSPEPVITPTPASTPTPAPSSSPAAPPIVLTQVNGYGPQSCPTGVSPSCEDGTTCRTLRNGCSRAYTCSAYTASGQDAAAVIPNRAPSRFDAVTGVGTVVTVARDTVNPLWNIQVRATAIGTARLECTVGGVSTNPSDPFVITVVP